MINKILHKEIEERLSSVFEASFDIPEYITDNLSHDLRNYQKYALQHFIYTQESDIFSKKNNHLLFHMATGSGKTLVLAATMLYLFREKGYQSFIFFVNSDAIIKKTIDNLTNNTSLKYLFNREGIVIDGQAMNIVVTETFPARKSEGTLYLKLTTIQKLHSDLSFPKENALSFDSLEHNPVILLADEAHHINVTTRNDKKKLSIKEIEEKNWENTVSKLLSTNSNNKLIEFTATINLDNSSLFDKYYDKIVYQYDLRQFMDHGFSKKVVLLRSNEEDDRKMLQALLLSQYRKYIALENKIEMKPIILFKSNKIATSIEANNNFVNLVNNLSPKFLKEFILKGLALYPDRNTTLGKMFKFYENKVLKDVIKDIQWDFDYGNILNANDSAFLSEENALLLNTLEDLNNPIRAIFAVAKLNEGWDVLNLFDIVRISEGATQTKAVTDSEAQLIGRGARYYPFKFEGKKSYERRFDYASSDLKIIETLHYHTINDSAYIKNLDKSLEAAEIQIQEDQYERLEAKVKPSIRKTDFYKKGKVYVNKVIPTSKDEYKSLKDYGVSTNFDIEYDGGVEQNYLTNTINTSPHKIYQTLTITPPLLRKALQRSPFFHFNNLKKFIPSISSLNDLIHGKDFFGNLKINVLLPSKLRISTLTSREKLHIVEEYLKYVSQKIKINFMKEKGTYKFESVLIKDVFTDYAIEFAKTKNKKITELVESHDMKNKAFYIFDKAIINPLEMKLVNFIEQYLEELSKKYKEVFLIRNEKKLKLVEFEGYRGFNPDFILYLKNHQDVLYQVFIEPKADYLIREDFWKQEMLLKLDSSEIEILAENEEVRLIGIKFFSDTMVINQEFREDFNKKILNKRTDASS